MSMQIAYQILRAEGYPGGRSIIGEFVRKTRGLTKPPKAYLRVKG